MSFAYPVPNSSYYVVESNPNTISDVNASIKNDLKLSSINNDTYPSESLSYYTNDIEMEDEEELVTEFPQNPDALPGNVNFFYDFV